MAGKLLYMVTILLVIPSEGKLKENVLKFHAHPSNTNDRSARHEILDVDKTGRQIFLNALKPEANQASNPANKIMSQNLDADGYITDPEYTLDGGNAQTVREPNQVFNTRLKFLKPRNSGNVLYMHKELEPDTKISHSLKPPSKSASNVPAVSDELSRTPMDSATLIKNPRPTRSATDASTCTEELFGGDVAAYQACMIQDALQNNWFPSPVAGLYYRSYLDWNGFDGFWQNGAILETMANFLHYTASSRYSEVFQLAGRSMEELLHAYYPMPSFDDEGWFAVSYARVYEVTGNLTYLNTSEYMYNFLWTNGWDSSMTCSGGMWFGGGHAKKITITNAQMLLLGAKLYRLTRNEEYLNRSLLSLDYLTTRVVNHTSYLLADSISPYHPNCTALPKFNITYNSGMFVGGLVELYNVTGNGSHLELAHRVAMATIENNSPGGVLLEYCDWDNQCAHDQDAQLFKGIFVRNVRYLMDVSNTTQREYYQKWLEKNIESALANARCMENVTNCSVRYPDGPSRNPTRGPLFTSSWQGPYMFADVISQTSVLDLFISAIDPSTECAAGDPACKYNPKTPDIGPLTCADKPCQTGHACCTWDEKYATCCMPYEQCYNGGCY